MAYKVFGKDVTWDKITMESQFEPLFYDHAMNKGVGPGFGCGVWSFSDLPCWD